jgi:plastocyanin
MLRLVAITGVAVAIFAAPVPVSATEPRSAGPGPRGGDGATVDVKIGDNYFRPKKLAIVAGTTVVWTNRGRNEHDVIPNRGTAFGIDELAPDQTYSFRFDVPGKYSYYCSFHGAPGAGQHATLKVVKPLQRGDSR